MLKKFYFKWVKILLRTGKRNMKDRQDPDPHEIDEDFYRGLIWAHGFCTTTGTGTLYGTVLLLLYRHIYR